MHRRQASSHWSWGASAIWGHHCGSGLARDGIGVKYLTDRTVSIAGKPDPTGHGVLRYLGTSLWERACSRWHQREIPDRPGRKHRRQARSHRSWGASAIWGHHCGSGLARDGISAKYLTDRAVSIAGKPDPTGHGVLRYLGTSLWERACSRWHRREIPDRPGRKHRRQARSHRSWGASAIWGHHCGSGLARDGIGVKYLTDRTVSIAGKPAPTRRSVFSGTPSKSPGVH